MGQITDIPHRILNASDRAATIEIGVYESGTSTEVNIYSDAGLVNPLANPLEVLAGDPVPTIYHGFAGDVRVEVVDAGSNILFDDDPYDQPVSTGALASPAGGEMVGLSAGGDVEQAIPYLTPERFGAVSGDATTASNFLSFLEYCRDNDFAGRLRKGATYYLAPNVFRLQDGQSLALECEGFAAATIMPASSSNTYLFTCSDAAALSIKGIRLGNATHTRLIGMTSAADPAKQWELELDRCVIDISGGTSRSAMVVLGYRRKMTITHTDFYGSMSAVTDVSDYSGQVLLDAGGGQDVSAESISTISDCRFFGGSLAFNLSGTNRPGPLNYINNRHFNQTISGTRLYHGVRINVDGLYYEGIGGANGSSGTRQGSAIFLDHYGPTTDKSYCHFGSIVIRDSAGIGILMEECWLGSYGPWIVDGMASVAGHSGVGGMAVLVGGACVAATITVSASNCATPIRINGTLTAVTGRPRNITFLNCRVFNNDTGGFLIDETSDGISFLGGSMHTNSNASPGTHADILVTTSAPQLINVEGVKFFDPTISTNSACCIKATVAGGFYSIRGNFLDAAGDNVVELISASGIASGNIVRALGKRISAAGPNLRIVENTNFRTQFSRVITTSLGSVYTLPKSTMRLGGGADDAALVQATYLGSNPDYKVAANINAGDVEIRLTNGSGGLVAGNVTVSASIPDAWR